MTKVMFIDLVTDLYDLHGVYSLCGVMKDAGIDVHFSRGRDDGKMLVEIDRIKPDLLLYTALSSNLERYAAFDAFVKKTYKVLSLVGGPGPTFDPTWFKGTTIDAVCIGEGEVALVAFIKSGFKSGKNIFYKDEPVPKDFYPLVDPDKLPLPDRDLVYQADHLVRDMPSKQFISGRGCPYQCTYCFNHEYNRMFAECGPVVRKKSVSCMLAEIKAVAAKYPLANVVFNDDTFIVNKKWFFEFAERFPKEVGLSYTCNVRANLVDEAMAKALKDSGCAGVNWSIESGDDKVRNEVLKRGMSRPQILECARALTKYKIPYRIGNVIGLPGETIEQMMATVALNIEARPMLATAAIFTPFPGLAVTRYAIETGCYDPHTPLPKNMFTTSVLKFTPQEIRTIQGLAYMFPLFIRFPKLFEDVAWRERALKLPLLLLRAVYHLFNTVMMMRMYRVRSSFMHRCRLAWRYVTMLLG
jgi:anaerobic magnesium-protoporphyrin IX monomethyl ester cyclase